MESHPPGSRRTSAKTEEPPLVRHYGALDATDEGWRDLKVKSPRIDTTSSQVCAICSPGG